MYLTKTFTETFEITGGVGAAVRGGGGCIKKFVVIITKLLTYYSLWQFDGRILSIKCPGICPGILDLLCPGIFKFRVGGLGKTD